jgi:phytoene synthase
MSDRALVDGRGYLERYGRSFHFASRFLHSASRERVASVYAYCRYTDDLVDEARGMSTDDLYARLDAWLENSHRAYMGDACGIPLVDRVMGDMRESGLPFRYASDLISGMRMDIAPRRYHDLAELASYTYRVAGVVGLWMTELFGVHEPWVMERAVALGHAMQLTNIVRDVGDDLAVGRVYLPQTLLKSYGLCDNDLIAMRSGTRTVSPAYRAAMEAMMTTADAYYRSAFDAMPYLPSPFCRAVAVAAEVYRGIHDEVRRAGYDTLTRRAMTTFPRKCVLGARGLRRLSGATLLAARRVTVLAQ